MGWNRAMRCRFPSHTLLALLRRCYEGTLNGRSLFRPSDSTVWLVASRKTPIRRHRFSFLLRSSLWQCGCRLWRLFSPQLSASLAVQVGPSSIALAITRL